MTLKEFIAERYPIDELVKEANSDPIKRIMENDDLPCDGVQMVDGRLQKVVEVTSGEYVTVSEILSYCREDIDKSPDSDFKAAYYAYMDNIDETNISIESIMSSVRDYNANKDKKEGLLHKCTQ